MSDPQSFDPHRPPLRSGREDQRPKSQSDDVEARDRQSERRAATLVIGGSLLSVLGMLAHPTARHAEPRALVADLAQIHLLNALVHGGLLIVMGAVFTGLIALSARLGWRSNRVRAAVVFQGAGFACLIVAALVDGFVVTRFASHHLDATDAELATIVPVLRLCFDVNQVAALAGIVALSIAIACWSAALAAHARGARAVAVLGFAVAAVPVLLHLAGHTHVDVHVMGAVVLVQGLWNIAAATWLLRTNVGAVSGA